MERVPFCPRLVAGPLKAATVLTLLLTLTGSVLASAIQNANREIEQQLQIAQEAEKNKDYGGSVAAYQKILRIRPDWALIHQSLGIVYHLQSKYPEAISSFEHALKLDPKLWGSHLFLGMDLYRTNQFSKAIPALEQAIQLNRELSENEARFWLGSSFLALEQFDEAVAQFRRLVELKPRDLEALFSLAQSYSQFSSALFKEIGKVNAESAEAHRLQGEWFESQAKSDRALGEYLQVAALRPDWEGVHQAISHLYLSKGQMEKAVLELEQELRIAPHDEVVRMELEAQKKRLTQSRGQTATTSSSTQTKDTDPSSITSPDSGFTLKGPLSLTSLGIERFRARDLKNAKEALSRVIQGDPRNSEALLYLARTHYALREFEESIQVLQARKPAAGHDLEMLYWLGKSYQELAASTLQKMIDIDPSSYRVHQMSGELFEEKTQYADALSAYQKVMKQSPDLAGIRYAIGNVYWKMQELDEALNWFKEELARNPYHALANYKVGNTYMLKGSPESAIPYLEKAVQANPGMLVAQQELAKSLMGQGRVEDAITRFKIVARADPQDESVHYLLSTAYKKLGRLEEANAELKLFSQLQQKKAEQDRKYLERRVSRDAESSPNQKRSLSSAP